MGLFDFLGGKKDSGRDAGNALQLNSEDDQLAKGQLANLLNYKDDPNIVDPIKGSRTATDEVQNNSILGQLFGKQGSLSNAVGEEHDLANRGYSLKPEDHEAYGQASDEIARQFGQSENSLASALSNRGLSNSGMAGQSFSGLQGNKNEQLAGMQRQIANDRMAKNQERLNQTRNFITSMGAQAGNQIQNQYNRQMDGANTQFNRLQDKNSAAQSRLQASQNQNNEDLKQRQGTEQQAGWAAGLQGIGNTAEKAGMAYATGGMGGGGMFDKPGESTGAMSTGKPKTLPATGGGMRS